MTQNFIGFFEVIPECVAFAEEGKALEELYLYFITIIKSE